MSTDLHAYIRERSMNELYLVVRKWCLQVLVAGTLLGLTYGLGTCHGALIVLASLPATP